MSVGPGEYDHLCTQVREQANAQGAIVIIIEGEKGTGFSIQAPLNVILKLPAILDDVAHQIRSDMNKRKL